MNIWFPYYINKPSLVQIGLRLFKWGHFHIFSLSYNLTSDDLWLWYMNFDLINKWGLTCCTYALRRLSSFVSLEFTKNVRCAVLLIRYAVPAQPHKFLISPMYGLVKKSIQPVYRNSESVRKCNCCRDWLITKVTISKMWNFLSCKVLKQLKFQVFDKDGLILTTQMVRYICFGHIISDGSISNTSEKVFPGPVHRAGTPDRHTPWIVNIC